MSDSIKGICLYRSVMQHIFENNILAYLQFMVKFPEAHKISTQTTVATYSIYMCTLRSLRRIINLQGFCISDSWHIRHLQTVGHMTGKTGIYDSCPDTFILNHIYYLSYKRPVSVRMKVWIAPSSANWVIPFWNCLRFMLSMGRTRLKNSGANTGMFS